MEFKKDESKMLNMNNRRRTGNNSVLVSLVSIRSPKAFSPNNDKNIKFSNISNVH